LAYIKAHPFLIFEKFIIIFEKFIIIFEKFIILLYCI